MWLRMPTPPTGLLAPKKHRCAGAVWRGPARSCGHIMRVEDGSITHSFVPCCGFLACVCHAPPPCPTATPFVDPGRVDVHDARSAMRERWNDWVRRRNEGAPFRAWNLSLGAERGWSGAVGEEPKLVGGTRGQEQVGEEFGVRNVKR